jgi:hypothetical protein
MELWKFESMVKAGSLYFRRVDQFDDRLEGRAPQAVWTLIGPEIQNWYRTNREHIFVCCFHLAEGESNKMWKEYANNYGVMIRTTVGALREELSFPPLPAATPYPADIVAMAEETGTALADASPPPQDGFTVGVVDYVDLTSVDVYDLMAEGLSNTTPMFRKGKDYIDELEYRAIMRPGSATGETATSSGQAGARIPVRLDRLLKDVWFTPADDTALAYKIEQVLSQAALKVSVRPSALGGRKP